MSIRPGQAKRVQKNVLLLKQIRKHVLERDNFTCQKCGVIKASESQKEIVLNKSHTYPVDVYDWDQNERLEYVRQVNGEIGSEPESYVTWCWQCSALENVEQYRVLRVECPRHKRDIDSCNKTSCWETTYDTEIVIWLNWVDLGELKELAHMENSTCRDLLTEAIHDLFFKYYERNKRRERKQ